MLTMFLHQSFIWTLYQYFRIQGQELHSQYNVTLFIRVKGDEVWKYGLYSSWYSIVASFFLLSIDATHRDEGL